MNTDNDVVSLTNLPAQRCVSVVSSQGSGSSDNSVCSGADTTTESPFMTLVDAATSILDRKAIAVEAAKAAAPVSPSSPKIPLAVEVKSPASPTSARAAPKGKDDCNKKQTFAELLMTVLEDPAHQDIMTWMPDGKAFTIRNHKRFTMELMPKLFNIRNMSSFVRKLGRWGFQRVHEKETRNSDIFKHKNFQQGNWELCKSVKCVGRLFGASNKASPASPSKNVIDLVNNTPGRVPLPSPATRSPSMVSRIPSPPMLVTPPTGDKALLRLEHARRWSAHTRTSIFRGGKELDSMTNEVVEAAIETLRRDEETLRGASSSGNASGDDDDEEETVIVAMPKKYLQSRRAPPGMRVLSSRNGSFTYHPYDARRSSYHQQQRARGPRSSLVMTRPVQLNTRPTQSGAGPAPAGPTTAAPAMMMAPYGGRPVPQEWALSRSTSYPSPSHYR